MTSQPLRIGAEAEEGDRELAGRTLKISRVTVTWPEGFVAD